MCDFTGLLIGRKDVDGFREGFTGSGSGTEDLQISVTLSWEFGVAHLGVTSDTKDTDVDILVRVRFKVLLDLVGDLPISFVF
jgi:hypothetical protein